MLQLGHEQRDQDDEKRMKKRNMSRRLDVVREALVIAVHIVHK